MTDKRVELLRELQRQPAPSVHALARALGRDYKNVHSDVAALKEAELIAQEDGQLRTQVDRLTVTVDL